MSHNGTTQGSAGWPTPAAEERLADLLLLRECELLAPAEEAELAALTAAARPDSVGELTRAIDAARGAAVAASMAEALAQQAKGYFAARDADTAADAAPDPAFDVAGRIGPAQATNQGPARWPAFAGWAAAAVLAVVAGVALLQPRTSTTDAGRAAAAAPDAVRLAFAGAAAGFERASGVVVWSDSAQAGVLEVASLPPAGPDEQYQLWIVDPQRDSRPVDGGVFDAAATGPTRVAFTPRLPVAGPAAFAITKEKRGGVVVSAGPLLVVAKR